MDECNICLIESCDFILYDCKHKNCFNCFNKLCNTSKYIKCPMCRCDIYKFKILNKKLNREIININNGDELMLNDMLLYKYYVDTYINIGLNYFNKKEYDKSIIYFKKTMEYGSIEGCYKLSIIYYINKKDYLGSYYGKKCLLKNYKYSYILPYFNNDIKNIKCAIDNDVIEAYYILALKYYFNGDNEYINIANKGIKKGCIRCAALLYIYYYKNNDDDRCINIYVKYHSYITRYNIIYLLYLLNEDITDMCFEFLVRYNFNDGINIPNYAYEGINELCYIYKYDMMVLDVLNILLNTLIEYEYNHTSLRLLSSYKMYDKIAQIYLKYNNKNMHKYYVKMMLTKLLNSMI